MGGTHWPAQPGPSPSASLILSPALWPPSLSVQPTVSGYMGAKSCSTNLQVVKFPTCDTAIGPNLNLDLKWAAERCEILDIVVDLIFQSWLGKQTLSAGIICPMSGSVINILIATPPWSMKQLQTPPSHACRNRDTER